MYYKIGERFKWFMARVVDIKDPEYLGRVKIRVINDQTGEVGKKRTVGGTMPKGILDDDLLWAWPLSAIQSASLSWRKVTEMEEFDTPDWIDAVGLSPTGIALSTYVFGFYLDGDEENIPIIFGTYHKMSRWPEPLTDIPTGEKSMLQLELDPRPNYFYSDVAALAKGWFGDPEIKRAGSGQTLPKEPYSVSSLWKESEKDQACVDEFPTAYSTEYPYNTTYTTKSGHAIELDDTPGHERVHIWHRSGCYEEISNGPSPFIDADTRSFAQVQDWPKNGPSGYTYKTAGGVKEDDYTGRRSKKTMDSSFEVVEKDHNELIKRDHNVEIANTESIKIGNSAHWTFGHPKNPDNRINDNGKTDYAGGGLDKYSLHLDVLNNTIQTSGNNFVLGVGITPGSERRIDKSPTTSQSMYIDVAKDFSVFVGEDYKSLTQGNRSETVEKDYKITANTAMFIECSSGGIELEAPMITLKGKGDDLGSVTILGNLFVQGAQGTKIGKTGNFTDMNGRNVYVTNGIITDIGDTQ